jgi:hypothetical protein
VHGNNGDTGTTSTNPHGYWASLPPASEKLSPPGLRNGDNSFRERSCTLAPYLDGARATPPAPCGRARTRSVRCRAAVTIDGGPVMNAQRRDRRDEQPSPGRRGQNPTSGSAPHFTSIVPCGSLRMKAPSGKKTFRVHRPRTWLRPESARSGSWTSHNERSLQADLGLLRLAPDWPIRSTPDAGLSTSFATCASDRREWSRAPPVTMACLPGLCR